MKPQLNMTRKRPIWLLLSLIVASALMVPNAFAATTDTDAGDSIDNVATINYQVGTVAQTPVNSNTATFVVDHKVRPVAANSADDNAVPSGVDEYLTFTVTNDGNTDADSSAVLAIQLTALQGVDTVEDDFDVIANSIRIYVESNVVPDGLQIGTDPLVTDYNTASLGTIDLARDQVATVYVVANMPATATNGQTALCHLIATAWSGAAALAEDGDGDDPAVMEVVWADDAGSLPAGDVVFNGLHSASATFTISTATLGVTKSSAVIASPFGAGALYRVPQATVQYTISILNTGAQDATSLQVVDQIPAGTDYILGSELSTLTVSSVDYSNTNQAGLGGYAPAGAPGTVDPAVTWIRINLTGTVVAGGAAQTAQFNVVIE